MAKLQPFLDLLDRQDVREVVLQNNAPPAVRTDRGLRAVSRQVLTTEAVHAIIQDSPLEYLLHAHPEPHQTGSFEDRGRVFVTRIAAFGDRLQIRIAHAAVREETEPKATPAAAARARAVSPPPPEPAAKAHLVVREHTPVTAGDADDAPPSSGRSDAASPPVFSVPPLPDSTQATETSPPTLPPDHDNSDLPHVLGGPARATSPSSGELRLPDWITPRRTPSLPTVTAATSREAEPRETADSLPPDAPPSAMPLGPDAPTHGEELLLELLRHARERGASDLLLASARPARIRRRGELETLTDTLSHLQVQSIATTLLTPHDEAKLVGAGHLGLAVELATLGRLRVEVTRQRGGLRLAVRLRPVEPRTPSELGLPSALTRVLELTQGLVLVSSPIGHGKSSTLAALVHAANLSRAVHIVTVEDPIEWVHPRRRALISQREVGRHVLSAAHALRAALRADPDLLAVDELVEPATIEMALVAAQTGALVLAAVNAPSAQRAIERLIERFPVHQHARIRTQLAGALKLVTNQRLLPAASGAGRVPAVEVVVGGMPLWALIRDDKLHQLPALIRRGERHGMMGLSAAIDVLVRSGQVLREEIVEFQGGEPPPPLAVAGAAPVVARPSLRALLEAKR